MKTISLAALFILAAVMTNAQQYYVNPKTGNDTNPGTQTAPLKTINEAAHRVNLNKDTRTTEIILSPGIHLLTETVLFNNNKYTSTQRLVIRAAVMPDDKDWSPQKMPVVVTVVPLAPGFGGDEARGIQPEVNHVTIAGIRFSGSPDYSYKNEKELSRSYPIWRDGKNLDDLLISQCLFAGNADVLPLHVGVIANGHGLVLDHCVFFNCKNPVVFWKTDTKTSNGNGMHYCLVYGSYFSGVWTTTNTNGRDFDFHHNIIANCKTGWIREQGDTTHFKAHDCIFTGNGNLAGFGAGPNSGVNTSATDFLTMTNVTLDGKVEIEMDQSKRNYLQLKQGLFGSELKAGLFKN